MAQDILALVAPNKLPRRSADGPTRTPTHLALIRVIVIYLGRTEVFFLLAAEIDQALTPVGGVLGAAEWRNTRMLRAIPLALHRRRPTAIGLD